MEYRNDSLAYVNKREICGETGYGRKQPGPRFVWPIGGCSANLLNALFMGRISQLGNSWP